MKFKEEDFYKSLTIFEKAIYYWKETNWKRKLGKTKNQKQIKTFAHRNNLSDVRGGNDLQNIWSGST